MNQIDITSLSSKGQVVIPTSIRKKLGILVGTKLIIFSDGQNVLLKPVQAPKLQEFKKLIQESRKVAKKKGLKPSDINKIIKQVRNENSD